MDTLRDYAVFVAVVDSGGFTPAARSLGLTKSAVSKRVALLEDRLGARLLDRTTRRLRPTGPGLSFLESCRRVLAEVEAAEAAVSSLHTEARGTLRVNAPMSFGLRHLGGLLPPFLERHPGLSVDLVLNDRVVDLIDEGFDVAVRIADLVDSALIARRLAPARLVVCAAPAYWRRHGRPERPQDLAGHECLIYSYQPNIAEWPFRMPGGGRGARVGGRLRANNGDVLRAAAVAGLGVALAPTFIVGDDLRAGRLETALEGFEAPPLAIHAVFPPGRHPTAKVRAFVDHMIAALGPRPYWDEGLPEETPA